MEEKDSAHTAATPRGSEPRERLKQLKEEASRQLALGLFDQAAEILRTILEVTNFEDEKALNTLLNFSFFNCIFANKGTPK